MRNWEDWGDVSDLTAADLFVLIRDAVAQGTVDAQTLADTDKADRVRADLEKAKDLPPIRQING